MGFNLDSKAFSEYFVSLPLCPACFWRTKNIEGLGVSSSPSSPWFDTSDFIIQRNTICSWVGALFAPQILFPPTVKKSVGLLKRS